MRSEIKFKKNLISGVEFYAKDHLLKKVMLWYNFFAFLKIKMNKGNGVQVSQNSIGEKLSKKLKMSILK